MATIGTMRISEDSHHKIKYIAGIKGVTIQEVVRVLIDFALEEFEIAHPEHFSVTGSES